MCMIYVMWFLFCLLNDTVTTEIYTYGHTLSLHDALPISDLFLALRLDLGVLSFLLGQLGTPSGLSRLPQRRSDASGQAGHQQHARRHADLVAGDELAHPDRKSTRLNSSH